MGLEPARRCLPTRRGWWAQRATGPKPAGRGQVGNSEVRRRPAHDPGGFLLATRKRRAPIADPVRGRVRRRADGYLRLAGDGAEAGWKGPSRELRGPTPAGA